MQHWNTALKESYECLPMSDDTMLLKYLEKNTTPIIILLDELSTKNILVEIDCINQHLHAKILIFNPVPEVHHAITLLDKGIKGYENSYINKVNLLKMIKSIENGKNWLFGDLTNYIINQYIQETSHHSPDFLEKLTQKEKEIAHMISDGLSNKEIVKASKIALSTVKNHISKIFEKAEVTDRVALVLKFHMLY